VKIIVAAIVGTLTLSAIATPRVPSGDITAAGLRSHLEVFADDSMQGRQTGTLGLQRATQYLVAELTRLGVAPGGTNGEYYEQVPVRVVQVDLPHAAMRLNGLLHPGVDFVPLTSVIGLAAPHEANVSGPRYVRGGRLGAADAVAPASVAGRFVVFQPPLRANGQPDYQLWNVRAQLATYERAAAIFVATLDLMPRSAKAQLAEPRMELRDRVSLLAHTAPIIAITQAAAEKAFTPPSKSVPEERGIPGAISYESHDVVVEAPVRNVVAVIEGSDPQLKAEFVVLSAHADHLGVARTAGRVGSDSIYNGADDSGTGSIALLEIAQHIASLPVKPKRSVLFLWTVGEEQGLLGAEQFMNHPTVPRDKIVANITVDMIGRGGADDVQVNGSRRISTEFGDWISATNLHTTPAFRLDEQTPRDTDVCDGDDWHFARWGIPSVRISTGRSADYHQVTDDVSKIDFDKYARLTRFVAALAEDFANRPERPRADKAKPDPRRACVR
jgi:hypothetical protein